MSNTDLYVAYHAGNDGIISLTGCVILYGMAEPRTREDVTALIERLSGLIPEYRNIIPLWWKALPGGGS